MSKLDKILFTPPRPGCVLSLPGLPGAGQVIRDISPYGNHGTFKGAGEPAWSRLASGLWVQDLDGVDDLINCGNSASLNPNYITLLAWTKRTQSVKEGEIISRWGGGGCYTLGFYDGASGALFSKVVTSVSGQVTVTDPNPPTFGVWYLVASTWDGTSFVLYRNTAVATTTAAGAGTVVVVVVNTEIGHLFGNDNYAYEGSIALPRIYSRALSAVEIATIFAQERGLFGV